MTSGQEQRTAVICFFTEEGKTCITCQFTCQRHQRRGWGEMDVLSTQNLVHVSKQTWTPRPPSLPASVP